MEENKKPKQGQINIELDADVAQGIYSNLAIINHSQSEFIVDFVSINVSRFEQQHGVIKGQKQPSIPINFGPTGEA